MNDAENEAGNDAGWGEDATFAAAVELLTRAAASELPLLVRGETGTGKERAARAAHAASARSRGPFVALNCGAIPDALIESELFGHARGAFTGAAIARPGLVEEAERGTLFLDEVGDASPLFQMKLLRVLAERTYRRLGETRIRAADVRVVAATHRDLEGDAARGRFRSDLWYRLAAVEVVLPPLRERGNDALLLAGRFLERARRGARFDAAAERALTGYAWPGNVRELEWAVARAALLAPAGDVVPLSALPERVRTPSAPPGGLRAEIEALEARRIAQALAAANGRPGGAARALGISRQGLWKKLRRARRHASPDPKEESCRRRR